jgi:photosystem II stability/assembly factor-like uncharacterized protein
VIDGEKGQLLPRRARRGLTLIAVGAVVVLAVGIAFLRPGGSQRSSLQPSTSRWPFRTTGDLVSFDFVNPSLGWALQSSTTPSLTPGTFWVSRTTDGAKHWQTQLQGAITAPFSGRPLLQFFDNSHGFVAVGDPMELFRTGDGGSIWTRLTLPEAHPTTLTFSDPRHGWLLGFIYSNPTLSTNFYASDDAGDTWHSLPNAPPGSTGLVFRSSSEGWLWSSELAESHLYFSDDAGQSWQIRDPLPPSDRLPEETVGLVNVRLLPDDGGVVAELVLRQGQQFRAPLYKATSVDLGISWRYVTPPVSQSLEEIEGFQDATHWWRIDQGTLYKSSDSGQSWKQSRSNLESGLGWTYSVHVLDAAHAWAQVRIGATTGLTRTSNGGLTWVAADVPQTSEVQLLEG